MERIFVLGAKDPEMDAIEEILNKNNQKYVYASIDDKRCHPGNSYSATNDLKEYDEVIYIESDTIDKYENTISLDHHKEGDYGYDLKYHLFLDASSIGQLIKYLIKNDLFETETEDFYMRASFDGYMFFAEDFYMRASFDGYMFFAQENSWYFRKSLNEFIRIPKKYVLIAAADHSLSQAYKGLCVGVSHDELFEERILDIANPFNNDVEEVNKTMRKYMKIFMTHSSDVRDLTYLDLGTGYSIDYLCIRELAISYDQPIVVKTKDSQESKERFMFLSISADTAEEILESKRFNDITFTNVFGVPNRGYVGGFI